MTYNTMGHADSPSYSSFDIVHSIVCYFRSDLSGGIQVEDTVWIPAGVYPRAGGDRDDDKF